MGKTTKLAAIYDPYLATLGGGERYCLTVAEILKKRGFKVDLFWSGSSSVVNLAQDRFSLDLSDLRLQADIFCQHGLASFINRYFITRKYDLFFYLSDGSLPCLFSRRNLIHFQVPFNYKFTPLHRLLTSFKKRLYFSVICNSSFTQKFIQKSYGLNTTVLYPPVDTKLYRAAHRQLRKNHILSVARFDNILNTKKQEILIKAFRRLSRIHPGWRLVLAGATVNPNNSFLKKLFRLIDRYPVDVIVNPSFHRLRQLYQSAKIFWHAAGYRVDFQAHPESAEHFGMAVVEAMAAGLVPLVINQGGVTEIVRDQINGFFWQNINQLVNITDHLIKSPTLLRQISRQAAIRSKEFSKEKFTYNFLKLIK